MNNNFDPAHEEQCNQEFLSLTDEIAKIKATLARLEQRRDNVYPGTLFYRLEQEHKRMLDDFNKDEFFYPDNDNTEDYEEL